MAGDPYPKPAPRKKRKWRKPLPFRSAKREAQMASRYEVIDLVRDRDRTCRAGPRLARLFGGDAPRCWTGIDDVHEIKTRARGGSILDADNCIGVCRPCHNWITTHPEAAHALGLVKHSWEN